MNRAVIGLALVALGIGLAIVSVLANVIGLSENQVAAAQFGWKQVAGLVAGVLLAVAGLLVAVRRRDEGREAPSGPQEDEHR